MEWANCIRLLPPNTMFPDWESYVRRHYRTAWQASAIQTTEKTVWTTSTLDSTSKSVDRCCSGPDRPMDNQIEQSKDTLTCIDPMTNFTEAVQIRNKSSKHVAEQFYNCWLSRYPTPVNCIYDNGGEFIGAEFKDLLNRAGINKKPTTIKNPTANAICKRMHDTIAMMLRTKSKTITEEEHAEGSW